MGSAAAAAAVLEARTVTVLRAERAAALHLAQAAAAAETAEAPRALRPAPLPAAQAGITQGVPAAAQEAWAATSRVQAAQQVVVVVVVARARLFRAVLAVPPATVRNGTRRTALREVAAEEEAAPQRASRQGTADQLRRHSTDSVEEVEEVEARAGLAASRAAAAPEDTAQLSLLMRTPRKEPPALACGKVTILRTQP